MHDRLVTKLWFFMHDGPEVISSAFVSPLLAVFQGNDFLISRLRGREVSLTHLAHNQEIAGAEPACATIFQRLVTANNN